MKIFFGRKQHDLLVQTIEQQAAVIDSNEHQITVLTRALAEAQRQRDKAQADLTISITRRGELRHQVDLANAKIAELTDGTSEPPAKEL